MVRHLHTERRKPFSDRRKDIVCARQCLSKVIQLKSNRFISTFHLLTFCSINSYFFNVDFHLKWRSFEQKALEEAKLHHSSSSDPAAGENLHPAFKKYVAIRTAYEDLHPSQSAAAEKNRKACKAVEKALGVRKPGVTGKLLSEVKGDEQNDAIIEGANAVNGGEADETVEIEVQLDIVEDIKVGGTKKKRKRRKGKCLTSSINDFDERKSKLFDMMEGFLKPSGGETSKKQNSSDKPYADLTLDELQIKIEEQEKKMHGSLIVKKIATKILKDLEAEVNTRFQ